MSLIGFYQNSKNKRKEITQLEKVYFIKESELKLTQNELFLLFYFKRVAAYVSRLVCMGL